MQSWTPTEFTGGGGKAQPCGLQLSTAKQLFEEVTLSGLCCRVCGFLLFELDFWPRLI